ncbi:MAG: 5-fold beta-flower protein [Chryseolinea sp.]
MKGKSIFMIMLMLLTFSLAHAQDAAKKREMPPKHRGLNPRLQADGTVTGDDGKPLGSIKNGKVCDVTGHVIGVIADDGDVTTASGKMVGQIGKDGSFKSTKGHVVTTDPDGVVKVSGKEVAKVAAGYKDKSHGCALHCFFSAENDDAKKIDEESIN